MDENNSSVSIDTEEPASPDTSTTPEQAAEAPSQAAAGEAPETATESGRTLKLNKQESTDSGKDAEAAAPSGEEAAEGERDGGSGNNRRGRNRRQRRRDPNTPSANPMSLTELKNKSTQELIDMAQEMGLENMARRKKSV